MSKESFKENESLDVWAASNKDDYAYLHLFTAHPMVKVKFEKVSFSAEYKDDIANLDAGAAKNDNQQLSVKAKKSKEKKKK